MKALVKLPVALAGIAGVAFAAWLTPTRMRVPIALLVAGLLTFGLVGLAGLSVINRYLLVPSLMVMIFAAVAVAGWTMLNEGRARKLLDVRGDRGRADRCGVDGAARRPRAPGQRASLPRQLAPLARRAAREPQGPCCRQVRLRPDAEPSADPRRALGAGPAGGPRRRAQRQGERREGHDGTRDPRREPSVFLRQGSTPTTTARTTRCAISSPAGYERIAFTPFYSAYARCSLSVSG